MRERELLGRLPARARAALRARASTRADERMRAASIACEAVDFPATAHGIPLPEDLTPAQRAVAELLAPHNVYLGKWAMPSKSFARMRWLGLAPPSVLERVVPFADGKRRRVPLWRALVVLSAKGETELRSFVRSLKLSRLERFELFVDVSLHAYYSIGALEPILDAEIDDSTGAWAAGQADRIVTMLADRGRNTPDFVPAELATTLLLAIVRAGIAIEPRWDILIRPRRGLTPAVQEILRAIPEPRRGIALSRLFTQSVPLGWGFGLALLAAFPSATLTQAILGLAGPDGQCSKQELLAKLAPIAKKHEVVRNVVDAFRGKQPRPIVLKAKSEIAPPNVASLTKLQRRQLSAMLKVYDGEKRSLEARFGDEPRALGEQAFRIRAIVDARGKLAYEAFSWLADDGCVFKAGTTEIAALLIQHGIDNCDDPRLEEALDAALDAKPSRRPRR